MKGLYDQSSPQMGPFPPNEVGRIAQHVRKGEWTGVVWNDNSNLFNVDQEGIDVIRNYCETIIQVIHVYKNYLKFKDGLLKYCKLKADLLILCAYICSHI